MRGSILPTIWIGIVVLLKAILPIIYRYAIVKTEVTNSSNTLYKVTWGIWVYSYLALYGLLMILWPITYFNVKVIDNFYIAVHWWGGVWGGVGLYALIVILFLAAAAMTGGSWLWFALFLLIEPGLWFVSYWFHPQAVEWYIPKYVLKKSAGKQESGKEDPFNPDPTPGPDPKPVDPT